LGGGGNTAGRDPKKKSLIRVTCADMRIQCRNGQDLGHLDDVPGQQNAFSHVCTRKHCQYCSICTSNLQVPFRAGWECLSVPPAKEPPGRRCVDASCPRQFRARVLEGAELAHLHSQGWDERQLLWSPYAPEDHGHVEYGNDLCGAEGVVK
jgi:hypothetical protein